MHNAMLLVRKPPLRSAKDNRGHQPGPCPDGQGLRRPLRGAGLDRRVVRAARDPGGGQHRGGQLPPPAAADERLRRWHHVVIRRQRFPTKGKSLTARALSRYFAEDRKSTRLNSSHVAISYTVF